MNKKILLLTVLVMAFVSVNVLNFYFSSKKELKNEFESYTNFKKEANMLIYLKNRYSAKNVNMLKRICKIQNTKITCEKLNARDLRKINSFLKSNTVIKTFSIKDSNGTFSFYAEIVK